MKSIFVLTSRFRRAVFSEKGRPALPTIKRKKFSVVVLTSVIILFCFGTNSFLPINNAYCGNLIQDNASWEGIASCDGSGLAIYRVKSNPLVYVVDFPDLTAQAKAMNRLAFFVENKDNKGLILDARQMQDYYDSQRISADQYYHGHDYRAVDLARFFNAVAGSGKELNPEEVALLHILKQNDVLHHNGIEYEPVQPYKVLISISRSKEDTDHHLSCELRRLTLRHEMSHAEYFTNNKYRQYCRSFWMRLKIEEQEVFRKELSLMKYDSQNDDLIINEMQAFLWEPQRGGFIDFSLNKEGSSLAGLRQLFLKGIDESSPRITTFFDNPFTRDVIPITKSNIKYQKEETSTFLGDPS
ncbi:MAG: hypothetical protein WCJ37_00475 [Syntrophus sp. (in: bacteria)]